jgi:hypothetical protein
MQPFIATSRQNTNLPKIQLYTGYVFSFLSVRFTVFSACLFPPCLPPLLPTHSLLPCPLAPFSGFGLFKPLLQGIVPQYICSSPILHDCCICGGSTWEIEACLSFWEERYIRQYWLEWCHDLSRHQMLGPNCMN